MESNLKPVGIKQEFCGVIIKEEVSFELIEEQSCIDVIKEESEVTDIKEEKTCFDLTHVHSFTLKEENILVNHIQNKDLNSIDANNDREFIKEEKEINYVWPEDLLKETDPLALPEIKYKNEFGNTNEKETVTSVRLSESSSRKDVLLKSSKPEAVITKSSTPQKKYKQILEKNKNKCFPPPLNINKNQIKSTLEFQEISSTLVDTTKPLEHLNKFQQVELDNVSERENEDSDYLPSSDEGSNESDSNCNSYNKIRSKLKDKIYITNSKVNGDNSSSGITLKSVEKDSCGKIIRNKGHCCLFCYKVMVNLPRHMELVHNSEIEVAKLLVMEKNSINRRNGFTDLSRVGDYYHNCEVLTKKTGELILVRRPKPDEEFAFNKYSPCPDCLGFMLKKHLWHHVKFSCTSQGNRLNVDNVKKQYRRVLAESKVLLESSLYRNIPSVFVEKILSRLRQDQVSEVCKEDELIINFGVFQFEKYGLTQLEMTRQYMRQLARLLIVLKENNHNKTKLSEWLKPESFDEIIDAVKKVCIQENPDSLTNRPTYKIPSLALKLGHNIRKCIGIERGQALRVCNKEKNKQLKDLTNIMELEWTAKISSNALATMHERKMNKNYLLPVTEDLVKLNEFLKDEIDKIKTGTKIFNWFRLAELTLCKLVLFNKRRSGEASRLNLQAYTSRPDWTKIGTEDMKMGMSDLEKKLSARLGLIEIVGKGRKKVPLLLTPDIKENIDILNKNRETVGISRENEYVFARVGDLCGHIRGHDCLKKFTLEAGLKAPHLITSTNLRKYIATVVQIFNLTETETDWLARHLGHDIRVHREFYRTHEATVETTKISRILLAVEQGKGHLFAGKKLDDINTDLLQYSDESEQSDIEELYTDKIQQGQGSNVETNQMKSKTSKNIRAAANKKEHKEKVLPYSDELGGSDSDMNLYDHNVVSHKGRTKNKQNIGSKNKVNVVKRPWSSSERDVVLTYFQSFTQKSIIPKKEHCDECKNKYEDILIKRSWKDIKYFVHNYINKNKKKKE